MYVVNMCVLQGVARVHLVQLWLSFGLYCGGLTVVGSVFVHQVIQRGGGLMLCGSVVVQIWFMRLWPDSRWFSLGLMLCGFGS